MISEYQIKKWRDSGIISDEQYQKILAEIKHDNSNKVIASIATIGALFLGIGIILFIAANWQVIPSFIKVSIILSINFIAYYLGYYFRYQRQNLPKIGLALIFLGSLMFGANIFLITQIYHLSSDGGNTHWLILIWITGVLPLIYLFYLRSIAALCSILLFVWLFVFLRYHPAAFAPDTLQLPLVYVPLSFLLFGLGTLHAINPRLLNVARTFRLFGINFILMALFSFTFSGAFLMWWKFGHWYDRLTISSLAILLLAIGILIINGILNPLKEKSSLWENIIGVAILLTMPLAIFSTDLNYIPYDLAVAPHLNQSSIVKNILAVSYNVLFAIITILIILIGYKRSNIKMVWFGTLWLMLFISIKYFDWFWGLLDRSLFFMGGGIILLLSGLFMERKLRQLKKVLTQKDQLDD